MSNYATLKAAIAAAIKQNGNNEITGTLLQQQLLAMVNSLGVGYQFAGIATPDTNPGTPDQNVFYIAIRPGVFSNFGGTIVKQDQFGIFTYNGNWSYNIWPNVLTKSSGWSGMFDYTINSGDDFIIEVFSGDAITYIELYSNGQRVQEIVKTISPNEFAIITPNVSADQIRVYSPGYTSFSVYMNGSTAFMARYNTITLSELLKEISPILKYTSPSSGWGAFSIELVANNNYSIINFGQELTYIQFYYSDSTESTQIPISIPTNGSYVFAPAKDVISMRLHSNAGPKDFSIYPGKSVYTFVSQLDATNIKKLALVQTVGSDENKIMSQKTVTNNLNSVFEDCPTLLQGIVKFLFLKPGYGSGKPVDYYQQFRVTQYYFNTGGFYLYLQVEAYDGTNWQIFDMVEISTENAPTDENNIKKLKSKYSGFYVWIDESKMATGSSRYLVSKIRTKEIPFYERDIKSQIDDLETFDYRINDTYELKDTTKKIIKVKQDGTGDFTSIGAAYASITDSGANNQYEIVVYPGIYHETNLIPPIFTHTHGLKPNTVTVQNQGLEANTPVFDLQGHASKLSNMEIISYLGYCIHLDISLDGSVTVCENLRCRKVYNNGADVRNLGWKSYSNPSVLGIGADFHGAKFIFKSCTFVDGYLGSHTNPNDTPNANQVLVYENCKLINAMIDLQTLGNPTYNTDGLFNCIITNLETQPGCPSVIMRIAASETGATKPNVAWQISGGNNKNFAVTFDNQDTTHFDIADYWDAVNSTEKTYIELASGITVEKFQFIDVDGGICNGSTKKEQIMGIALADSGDYLTPLWVGNALPFTGPNGEYGIGSDGKLSASATQKIGYVKNNIFYRY